MSSQQNSVFDGMCSYCVTLAYTCDIGFCKSCGGGTSSGAFSLCAGCAIAKRLCMHCGNPPEVIAAKLAEQRSNLTHIPYVAALKLDHLWGPHIPRAEVKDLASEAINNFADSIKQDFPTVNITNTLMNIGILYLDIPASNEAEIVSSIRSKYNCTLAQGDIPIKLIS